jgi:hypothetical protein
MSTTYTWEITNLESFETINELTNVVSVIYWTLRAEDGFNSTTINGTVNLDAPTADTFVNYNDLTQEQVISWVKTKLGITLETGYYQYLDEKLLELTKPAIISTPLPWIPVPVPNGE